MNNQSRRRYPRLEFGIRVFEEKDWMIRDLSPLGCFIETSNPLPTGEQRDLRFQIPLEQQFITIETRGIVRRSEPNGMAIEFIDLDPEYSRRLENFVKTYY
ncbi:MAG: PilZ domain-containing protein [Syntrophobacteria bacterium]